MTIAADPSKVAAATQRRGVQTSRAWDEESSNDFSQRRSPVYRHLTRVRFTEHGQCKKAAMVRLGLSGQAPIRWRLLGSASLPHWLHTRPGAANPSSVATPWEGRLNSQASRRAPKRRGTAGRRVAPELDEPEATGLDLRRPGYDSLDRQREGALSGLGERRLVAQRPVGVIGGRGFKTGLIGTGGLLVGPQSMCSISPRSCTQACMRSS